MEIIRHFGVSASNAIRWVALARKGGSATPGPLAGDRRSVRISLTEKGREVHEIVDQLYAKHVKSIEQVGGINSGDFQVINKALVRLERFWTDQIRYRL